jgi:diadenylate cyclase
MDIAFIKIHWTDILDILLVSLLLYQVYSLVRGSIASRVFAGYMLLYVFYLIIKALGLNLMTAIMQYFMGVGAIALIVIFQQEIRRFLILVGRSATITNNRFLSRFFGNALSNIEAENLSKVIDAARSIASDFNGALIVVRKQDDLAQYIETGIPLRAVISKQLLLSIFSQYSALNEGAVILADGKIEAARCVLPVNEETGVSASIGFRHRAALGMSESTDAAVIVISEQTGRISLAIQSELHTNLSPKKLAEILSAYLYENEVPASERIASGES